MSMEKFNIIGINRVYSSFECLTEEVHILCQEPTINSITNYVHSHEFRSSFSITLKVQQLYKAAK